MHRTKLLYDKLDNNRVRCTACARYCELADSQDGLCGVRGNVNGELDLYVYGRVIAGCVDPIEKKPVIHYRPGSRVYSIATTGCNWLCAYCQNHDISQRRKVEGVKMSPEQVVQAAIDSGSDGIAYTYNQPSIFVEFARDCGVEAHRRGLFNAFVSNGYDTPQTVEMMGEFLDCITIDFKGSAEPQFTRKYIGVPDVKPIFDTLIGIRDKTRIHVEITDLIVPQLGDSTEYCQELCKFVYDELGADTPIHFLRFHPDYKMNDVPATPIETLEEHHKIAIETGLRYAYVGNVPGHRFEHTYCPSCNKTVVARNGFGIEKWDLNEHNECSCGQKIPILGAPPSQYRPDRLRILD